MRQKQVYKISLTGRLMCKFDNYKDAAKAIGVKKEYMAVLLFNKRKYKDHCYFSYEIPERLGKRSNIEAEVTIADISRMAKYRDNLILSITNEKTDEVLNEIVNLTKLLQT